jgi:hypothetical protein
MADTNSTQDQPGRSDDQSNPDESGGPAYVDKGGPVDDTSGSGGLGGIDAGSPGGMGGSRGAGGTGGTGRPPGGVSPVQIEQATQAGQDDDQA